METKDRIQEAALELFSEKGFDSSSVRDIAAKIGIKDSSLYFHYKSKQAILDSLTDKFIHISEQMMEMLRHEIKSIDAINDAQFYMITEQYIQGYFMDSFISRFIMVMNHERSHNAQLRKQYIDWCVMKPLEFQTIVFEKLQEIGYLKKLDARHLALEYYAPIFLFFNQYINHAYTQSDREAFQSSVMTACKSFLATYRKGN